MRNPTPITQGVPSVDAPAFNDLLARFPELLSEPDDFTTTRTTWHFIRLQEDRSFHIRPYSFSTEEKQIINDQVEEMVAKGIIEPTVSAYCSPVVLVKKEDGNPRFCVDYRNLNALSVSEATPMPVIAEALRDLGAVTIFSSIDLKSGSAINTL